MSEDAKKNPEDPQADSVAPEAPAPAAAQAYPKINRVFSKLAIELDSTELSEKGVQKMILAEIARLETEVARLRDYQDKYVATSMECAVLKAHRQKSTMLEVLYSICLAVGFGLLGWVPANWSAGGAIRVGLLAAALIVVAVVAKILGVKQ